MGMRHAVLVLSMGTVVLYGYALAGLGGYMMGRGRPDYFAFGLIFCTLSGAASIFLWKKYILPSEACSFKAGGRPGDRK